MSLGYWETLASAIGDGPTQTAVGPTSLLGTTQSARTGLYTMAANRLKIGDVMHLRASGRISVASGTPGTARFDLWNGAVAFMDTLAITLETTAIRTTVPWILDMEGIVRAAGQTANMFWQG